MNKFSWSVSFKWNKVSGKDLPFDSLKNIDSDWNTVLFCLWRTEFHTSEEIVEFIRSRINSLMIGFDISINTEDKIELLTEKIWDSKIYVLERYEWVDFDEVVASEKNKQNVVSIREAENDENWKRVIKVDRVL
ncbi:MAG: hypothetical protein ACD_3C00196G0004 [uncultured bacterium (gcode 4)]|uniref:Uncharacterized protein n=1 Tax=uncultured bacterium (gcode 4) TaxID=1234023 RepID=K2F8N1_9BACT|nr:MAG: hypothetical protein ACD_3C00196G0004 [uncultured bacterium (gcode 4)]